MTFTYAQHFSAGRIINIYSLALDDDAASRIVMITF